MCCNSIVSIRFLALLTSPRAAQEVGERGVAVDIRLRRRDDLLHFLGERRAVGPPVLRDVRKAVVGVQDTGPDDLLSHVLLHVGDPFGYPVVTYVCPN